MMSELLLPAEQAELFEFIDAMAMSEFTKDEVKWRISTGQRQGHCEPCLCLEHELEDE